MANLSLSCFTGQPGGLSVLPLPYAAAAAAAAAYGGWGIYPAPGMLQQQQQQQNGGPPGTPGANGQQQANGGAPRRPGTPNGSITPGPPEVPNGAAAAAAAAAAGPYVFPAYFDPNSGGLVRAAVPPGVRLLTPAAAGNPAAAQLLVGANGQAAPAGPAPGVNAPGALPGVPPGAIPAAALNLLGHGQLGPQGGLASYGASIGSPSLTLPGGGGARRDSLDRAAAFSPSLDKAKAMLAGGQAAAAAAAAAGWPYGPLGLGGTGGALTPPPGSLASSMNHLLHTRLSGPGGGGGGGDRGGGGFGGRNGTIGGLFGASNNLFANASGGGGGKHRHNSIDGGKQVNRSKLLEDFR